MKNIFALFLLFFLIACQNTDTKRIHASRDAYPLKASVFTNDFKDYWYAGKAEISSYELEQSRYGEIHRGKGVFIFVTEPFSKNKQVKLDNPKANSKDNVSVLKMNATRKFNTGIYPYSTMQSVFTPINAKDHPNTLNTVTTSQEWCGHTFEQLNFKNKKYEHRLFSYFESEGDQTNKLEKAWLEDELFNRIRIQPDALPEGDLKIIPGTIFARFRHVGLQVEIAKATLTDGENPAELRYQISYPDLGRQLTIYFKKSFPHLIESWEETSTKNPNLVTKATRIKTLKLDYWNKNGTIDSKYRKELELE